MITKIFSLITDLTHIVKIFSYPARLQRLRLYTAADQKGYSLFFEFYPEPKAIAFSLGDDGPVMLAGGTFSWGESAQHPVQLYLKAHFEGAFLHKVEVLDRSLRLTFGRHSEPSEGHELVFSSKGSSLLVAAKVPTRKDFSRELPLAAVLLSDAEPLTKPEPKSESVKHKRLLQNVKGDIKKASGWLEQFGPVLEKFEAHPEGNFSSSELKGLSRDKLFNLRRRMLRKLSVATKRLFELEAKGPAAALKVKVNSKQKASEKPRGKPGLWVMLADDLWARVGRNARENDELFAQAKDRDLWFHVRSESGGHVWVGRHQKNFGPKVKLPDQLLDLACQLALTNSRLLGSKAGEVEYTERRYLKKIPKSPGKLRIMRSETRFTRIKDTFLDHVFKAKKD
jgi:hypothetical protein